MDDDRCMTAEDSQELAKMIGAAGADAIQVRNQWLGYHVGGFLPDYLFYPEPPIPLREFPKEYNASHSGAGANIYLAEGLKPTLSIPVIVVGKLDPDNIIPTSTLKPSTGLIKSLEGKVPQIYAVGDCRKPGMIVDAIADGWQIANRI